MAENQYVRLSDEVAVAMPVDGDRGTYARAVIGEWMGWILPRSEWQKQYLSNGDVALGAFEVHGRVFWARFKPSDFPNYLASVADLERVPVRGVHVDHLASV